MVTPPRSRVDVARRVAHRLGVEFHADLLEIVPPVAWDDLATRAELDRARRAQDDRLERRLRAVRDALAAAHHDEARQLAERALALAVAVAASLLLVRARPERSSVTGRTGDHGGSCAGSREALHRRRLG